MFIFFGSRGLTQSLELSRLAAAAVWQDGCSSEAGGNMTTDEDVREAGIYVSDCCCAEVVLDKYDTFGVCPRCRRFCEWDHEQYMRSEYEFHHSSKVAA
jgi:hypothetical protein